MIVVLTVLLYHVILLVLKYEVMSAADPFYCDSQYNLHRLYSYAYTCDHVSQCIDGRDERGCVECGTGTLLLRGLAPTHPLFVYETTFVRQDYKLRNREVYKTEGGTGGVATAYIAYNDTSHRWVISGEVDRSPLLLSSVTYLSVPYLAQLQWSWVEDAGEVLPDVTLQCVTSALHKCYGNLLLVTPDIDVVLKKTTALRQGRPVYSSAKHTLQYVDKSPEWNTPHWQIVNSTGHEAVILPDSALHPELIVSPGVYKTTEGTWLKSSNVYLTCELLSAEPHLIDCPFQDGLCSWEEYRRNDFHMQVGSAEQFSVGTRRDPSLYITADQTVEPGKYRLTSTEFDVDSESCMLMSIANTVYVTDPQKPNMTITRHDLQSSDVVWKLTECTDTVDKRCATVQYVTEKITLPTGKGVQMQIDVELGANKQRTGLISISEITVVEKPCADIDITTDVDADPCLDWPCDSGYCKRAGLGMFYCDCSNDEGQTGATCSETYSCPQDLPAPAHTSHFTPHNTYISVRCEAGYALEDNALPLCLTNGSWSHLPACLPAPCPEFVVNNGSLVRANNSVTITCDEGFKLSTEASTFDCVKGVWDVALPLPQCLLDCKYEEEDREDINLLDAIWVSLQLCDYSTDSTVDNFTNCRTTNYSVDGGGYVEFRPDIHTEIDSVNKRTCVRFAEFNVCQEECSNAAVLKALRTVDSGLQSIIIISSLDWTDKIVSAAAASTFSWHILSLACFYVIKLL